MEQFGRVSHFPDRQVIVCDRTKNKVKYITERLGRRERLVMH